jgi:hypothetical protein
VSEFERERLDLCRALLPNGSTSRLQSFDACRVLSVSDATALQTGRGLLVRIVAMLTGVVVKLGDSGSGSG